MKRIAAFEKVSFAQYEKDFADAFPGHETAEIRAIYDDITKPKRATAGSAGYDFSAPVAFVLKPGETIKIRNPCADGRGLGAVPVSQKRTGL